MEHIKENIIETLIILDPDSKIRTVHKNTCDLLGYREEELIGNPVHVVLPATEETLQERKLDDLIKRDEIRNYETYLRTKDGKKIPILFNGSVMKDKKGNVDCIICTARETNGHNLAEETLWEGKDFYQDLMEFSQYLICTYDLKGQILSINKGAAKLLQYDHSVLLKMDFRDLIIPEGRDEFDTHMATLQKHGTAHGLMSLQTRTGERRILQYNNTLRTEGVTMPIVRVIAHDITESKWVEDALKTSEQEAKRLAQENATMAEIGRIISSTLNIEEVYERFAQEVRKVIPFDRVSVNTLNPDRTSTTLAYAFGVAMEDSPEGTPIPMGGSFYEDIVNQRSSILIQPKDENELFGRYSELMSHFQAGIRSMIVTPLISKDQLIGILHFQSLKPSAYTELDVRLAERVGNEIAGAIANVQLYAERKQAEEGKEALQEQLRQSQKMEAIGQLAGGVAHDFNNILTVIHGYSELVINSLDANNPIRDDVKEIKAAADRASALTRQLLAFSRKQVLQLKVLDLNSLVSNMVKMLRRMIGEGIELTTLLSDNVGSIKADPGQIEQVILNLAVNAKDAMPKGGKLTIETANVELDQDYADLHLNVVPGPYVMLSVSDTGVGMETEVREHILEPFFTTKEKGKGTGLGLSTVYGIVKQSGGNIWIYSEPGQGSTFKIYLPRVEEEVDSVLQSSSVGTKSQQGSETILLVEDEKMVRTLAQTILKRNGYNVLEAENGEEALRVVEEQKGKPINLMLTDLIMPRMNGRELSEHLKPLLPGIKVIYMSGYTDEAVSEHGMLAPGIEYIQKPFPPDALVKKVRSVLDRPR